MAIATLRSHVLDNIAIHPLVAFVGHVHGISKAGFEANRLAASHASTAVPLVALDPQRFNIRPVKPDDSEIPSLPTTRTALAADRVEAGFAEDAAHAARSRFHRSQQSHGRIDRTAAFPSHTVRR